jgi:hypothetical protein
VLGRRRDSEHSREVKDIDAASKSLDLPSTTDICWKKSKLLLFESPIVLRQSSRYVFVAPISLIFEDCAPIFFADFGFPTALFSLSPFASFSLCFCAVSAVELYCVRWQESRILVPRFASRSCLYAVYPNIGDGFLDASARVWRERERGADSWFVLA